MAGFQLGKPNVLTNSPHGIIQLLGRTGGGEGGGGGGPTGSGSITLGKDGGNTQTGYFENTGGTPLFGSITNNSPVPPVGSIRLRALVQESDLEWQVRITPNGLGAASWTSLTLTGSGGIVLLSANATYTDNSFGASFWKFTATADIWDQLSAGSEQTYTFA